MLLDHFHSPLKDIRPWTGLYGMWAGKLASAISRVLPDGWFAAPKVHWSVEVVEVQVFHNLGELTHVGAIEFVSPANKDRLENREAFVAKCDALLRNEVGLVIVDIVTSRRANLHRDLMQRLRKPTSEDSHLYLASYRPLTTKTGPTLNIYYRPLRVEAEIPPTLLFLKQGPVVELPLAETYRETCLDLKIERPNA